VKGGNAEVIKPPEELRKKALFILSDKEETGDSDVIATVTYSVRRKRTLEKA
jgi:hypothetical protein